MTRFIVTACTHLRSSPPHYRTDDFATTQLGKMEWIFKQAERYDCPVIIAGDVFNTAKVGIDVILGFMRLIWLYDRPRIFVVYGQHDLSYRSRDYTTLEAFWGNDLVVVLGKEPIMLDDVYLYGWSFDDADMPVVKSKRVLNVLVMHRMVAHGPLFPGHDNYIGVKDLLQSDHGYKLYLSGDNHNTVIASDKRTTIINPGSIVRQEIDEVDRTPIVVLCEVKGGKLTYKELPIPCRPASEVFDMDEYSHRKNRERSLSAFSDVVGSAVSEDINAASFDPMVALQSLVSRSRAGRAGKLAMTILQEVRNARGK